MEIQLLRSIYVDNNLGKGSRLPQKLLKGIIRKIGRVMGPLYRDMHLVPSSVASQHVDYKAPFVGWRPYKDSWLPVYGKSVKKLVKKLMEEVYAEY